MPALSSGKPVRTCAFFDHGDQAVRAGGAEVFFEADLFDEIEVGVQYFLRGMAGNNVDQQGDDPFTITASLSPLNRILPLRNPPATKRGSGNLLSDCFRFCTFPPKGEASYRGLSVTHTCPSSRRSLKTLRSPGPEFIDTHLLIYF